MGLYTDYIQNLQPAALGRRPVFLSFVGSFGAILDQQLERLQTAAQINNLGKAPNDALDTLGRERLFTRYPGETDDNYRARQKKAPSIWSQSGLLTGLVQALNSALPLNNDTSWYTLEYFQSPPSFGSSGFWSQFRVEADADPAFTSWTYGEAPESDNSYGDLDLTYGSTATPEQINLIIQTILDNKPAYATCAEVILYLPAGEEAHIILQGYQ
jgi:hypothetical protein